MGVRGGALQPTLQDTPTLETSLFWISNSPVLIKILPSCLSGFSLTSQTSLSVALKLSDFRWDTSRWWRCWYVHLASIITFTHTNKLNDLWFSFPGFCLSGYICSKPLIGGASRAICMQPKRNIWRLHIKNNCNSLCQFLNETCIRFVFENVQFYNISLKKVSNLKEG